MTDLSSVTASERVIVDADGVPAYILQRIVTPQDAERLALNELDPLEQIADDSFARFHVRGLDAAPCHAVLTVQRRDPTATTREYTLDVSVAAGTPLLDGNPPTLARAISETVQFAKTTFASERLIWEIDRVELASSAVHAGFALDSLDPMSDADQDHVVKTLRAQIDADGVITMCSPGRVHDVRADAIKALQQQTNHSSPRPTFNDRTNLLSVGGVTDSKLRRDFGRIIPVDVRGTEIERHQRLIDTLRSRFPSLGLLDVGHGEPDQFIHLHFQPPESTAFELLVAHEPTNGNAIDAQVIGSALRRVAAFNHEFPTAITRVTFDDRQRAAQREPETSLVDGLLLGGLGAIDDVRAIQRAYQTATSSGSLIRTHRNSLETMIDAEMLVHFLGSEQSTKNANAIIETFTGDWLDPDQAARPGVFRRTKKDLVRQETHRMLQRTFDSLVSLCQPNIDVSTTHFRDTALHSAVVSIMARCFWIDELCGLNASQSTRQNVSQRVDIESDDTLVDGAILTRLVSLVDTDPALKRPRFRAQESMVVLTNGILGIDNVRTGVGSMHGFIPLIGEKMQRVNEYNTRANEADR